MIFYLNIIIGPLECVVIFFFISSMYNLLCGVWADKSGDPVMRAQHKTRYVTVIKMFFAMGVTWLAETISHALEWAYGAKAVRYPVTVFKIINSLQGFILFCVIFFDATMIAKIKKRFFGIEPTRQSASSSSTAGTQTRPTKPRQTGIQRVGTGSTSLSSSSTIRKMSARLVPESLKGKKRAKASKDHRDDGMAGDDVVVEMKAASPDSPPDVEEIVPA